MTTQITHVQTHSIGDEPFEILMKVSPDEALKLITQTNKVFIAEISGNKVEGKDEWVLTLKFNPGNGMVPRVTTLDTVIDNEGNVL